MESRRFNAYIVWLILNGKAEQALKMLATRYHLGVPRIRVGLPKGRRKGISGCYNARTKMICVLESNVLQDPFTVLHEFYHHLRTSVDGKHKGTEKNADAFAREFIEAYQSVTVQGSENY